MKVNSYFYDNRIKIALLLGIYMLMYFVAIEYRELWQPDELRYAEITREMLSSGNWITPHFFGLRYFEKPIAGYWFNFPGQWLFGHTHLAVRFAAIASTTLSASLVYYFGKRLYGDSRIALSASVIYLTFLLVYGIGTYSVLDPILTLWLNAAMVSYWLATNASCRKKTTGGFILLGLACGMGFLTKGFLALAVPVLAIVPWAIYYTRFKQLFIYGLLTLLVAIVISAPWSWLIYQQQADFWHYFFWIEHIQRFAEPNAQHAAPFWYYLPVVIGGTLPWLALLPGSLWHGFRQRAIASSGSYLLSWFLLPLLFFSIAKGKLVTYILPCFAPLALLMANYAYQLVQSKSRILVSNGWINMLFGLIGMSALLILSCTGVLRHPLFSSSEYNKLLIGLLIFAGWAVVGILALKNWQLSALCPLILALGIGVVIPHRVENTKQPIIFLSKFEHYLKNSAFLVANNPGLGSAIAWYQQRSDIYLYHEPGEVEYGLGYPDSQYRFINDTQIAHWIETHRHQGSISLVLTLDNQKQRPSMIPKAQFEFQQQRMLFLYYDKQ